MLPHHLAQNEAQGLTSLEPVAQFEIGDYRNFVYLILSWESREAFVVDPQADIDRFLQPLRENRFQLKGVLLTHTHFDHIAGVPELLKRDPELPVYVHPQDQHRLANALRPRNLRDGETLHLGSLPIQVMHTPGHSAGECSYFLPNKAQEKRSYLFTGDTVFIRDCGRTDLDGGSNEQMFASIQRIKALPGETVILPGHHYAKECASTLSRELQESPPFLCKSVEELRTLP